MTLRDNALRRLCDADGEAIVNVWKTWSWTTAINQVDASAFEDWLVSTPTTGYSGVLTAYSRGTPWTVGAQARTERADPSLMLAAPKLIDVRPPTPAPRPGLGWAPPFQRFDASSLILERRSRRIHERTIPFDSSTRGGARGVHAQVLMSPSIRVLEPLWTLIPASKAILPVLWEVATRASPPLSHIGAGTGLTPVWAHGFYCCCDSCCCSRPCNCRRCAMRPLPLQCNIKQHQQPRQPLAYP